MGCLQHGRLNARFANAWTLLQNRRPHEPHRAAVLFNYHSTGKSSPGQSTLDRPAKPLGGDPVFPTGSGPPPSRLNPFSCSSFEPPKSSNVPRIRGD